MPEFRSFQNLPPELQDMIWEEIIGDDVPGLHQFQLVQKVEEDGLPRRRTASTMLAPVVPPCFWTSSNDSMFITYTALWNTCWRARDRVKKRLGEFNLVRLELSKGQSMDTNVPHIICSTRDIIFISGLLESQDYYLPGPEQLEGARNFALELPTNSTIRGITSLLSLMLFVMDLRNYSHQCLYIIESRQEMLPSSTRGREKVFSSRNHNYYCICKDHGGNFGNINIHLGADNYAPNRTKFLETCVVMSAPKG
ncbi:hypothetical protein BX600DRAFT_512552 [Xylariales sp. PMI_506]|nr:hypothetical protein BX600DRAFT_512552 [Xylariales sp. PMI_506]